MNTPLPSPLCPKCGAALATDAPEGLCPRCLASASLLGETVLTGDEATRQAPVAIDEIAPHFPHLEILECLGRGGMGIVYKARQKTLNRFVALKLLAPERVHDAAFAERFAREAQALAALSHPGIVTIYDFGEAGRYFYLLMEFVDGVNLRQAMKAGRFTPEEALAIVPPVCEALQYAHEHGIVHRDIKPENLLLDKEGRVKIADFGIAKMLNVNGSEVGVAETQPAGTPQYMAPEQKRHQRTDHRADIYSLGVVLYELLTGELPADQLQPPSRKVQIDVRLDEIVLRALEQTPELRYQTAGEFRSQVETVAGSPTAFAPADSRTPPRFSRTAIVGAALLPILPLGLFLNAMASSMTPGLPHDSRMRLALGLPGVILVILGQLSILATVVLGWVAVGQIRRSAGRLSGLWLAMFEGLLVPLLALDALIWWLWVAVIKLVLAGSAWHPGGYLQTYQPELVAHLIREWATVATVITALLVDFFIIRRVWRALQQPANSIAAAPTSPDSPTAAEPTEYARPADAHFSRLAVAAACWAPLFFICVFLWLWRGPVLQGQPYGGPNAVQKVLTLTLLPLGLLAPFGTTILGWVSVMQIKRSRGKLYGLGLAAFDGLFFPLATSCGLMSWFWWWLFHEVMLYNGTPDLATAARAWPYAVLRLVNQHSTACIVLFSIATATLVSVYVARRAWRRIKEYTLSVAPKPGEPVMADFAMLFAGLAGVLGLLSLIQLHSVQDSFVVASFASGVLGLALALPVRQSWMGKYALAVATCNLTIWFVLGVVVGSLSKWDSTATGQVGTLPVSSRRGLEVVHAGPPFVGEIDEGSVELIALAPHPAEGTAAWRADGSPATEPFPDEGGRSSAFGKVVREFAIRARSGTFPSTPTLNFDPAAGFMGMGSSTNFEGTGRTSLVFVQAIACPPEAREVSFTVAVAEGAWETVHVLPKPSPQSPLAGEQSSDAGGMWDAHLELAEMKGDVALAFHYSIKPLYETRMAVIRNDGTVSALSGNGSQGAGGMANSVASLTAGEYAGIKEFQLQKRPYQYVGFRHVSLQLGHLTTVEVASEARRPQQTATASPSAKDRERYELEAQLRVALAAYLDRKNTSERPGEDLAYRGMMVDLAPTLLSAEITIDQPRAQATSPHRAEWNKVKKASLIASHDGPGEWTITGQSPELGTLQFKLRTPIEPHPQVAAPPTDPKFGPPIEREMTAPSRERKALAEQLLPNTRATAEFDENRLRGGLITAEAMQALRDRVKILEADLTGDPVKAAEAELEAARQQVLLATKKFESGLLKGPDLEKLKSVEALARARLRDVKAQPKERQGINLETGELVEVPAEFVLQAGPDSPEQLKALEWMESHRVDAVVSFSHDGSLDRGGLLGAQMLVLAAADDEWTAMNEVTLDYRIKERLSQWGKIPRVGELMTSGRLPANFLFRTHAGGRGVLQISGFDTLTHRIVFRYRMIAAPPHVAEEAAPAPVVEEKKSVPATPLPPPKITLLDIERHTRGTIEAWDREGKALSNKIRWIVQPDVSLPDEGEPREDRVHYCVSLLVENEPPNAITHGDWRASFGDGVGSARLASIRTPDGPAGVPYRISTELPPDRKRIGIRFGIPIKDWEPVLVLQGPDWKGGVIGDPFDKAETPPDLGARVSLVKGSFPLDTRFGQPAGVPMTRLKLKLPAGLQYEWDWHVVLFDAAGKSYEADGGGGWRTERTDFPLEQYDPNTLTADYHLPEPPSIVKIVVNARSHERDYFWAEFKDLPLASSAGESKIPPAEANAADPVEAIELKVARGQLETTLNRIQQTRLNLQTPPVPDKPAAEQEGAKARLELELRVLEEEAAKLRALLRAKSATP